MEGLLDLRGGSSFFVVVEEFHISFLETTEYCNYLSSSLKLYDVSLLLC
jgi:hypothetical protein